MYKIRIASYGLNITISGRVDLAEVKRYSAELEVLFTRSSQPMGVLVDVRDLIPPTPEVLQVFQEVEEFVKRCGLTRMALVIASPVIEGQAKRIGLKSKLHDSTLYVDAIANPNWEAEALSWIKQGIHNAVTES